MGIEQVLNGYKFKIGKSKITEKPKIPLNIKTFMGVEVFKTLTSKEKITSFDDLSDGDTIFIMTPVGGYWEMLVFDKKNNEAMAKSKKSDIYASLKFSPDERKCWVATSVWRNFS